jgi:hypothetical protein
MMKKTMRATGDSMLCYLNPVERQGLTFVVMGITAMCFSRASSQP